MCYLLLCASVATKTYDYGQEFHFYHKTKWKAADKTLEQHFLKEFKATCKNSDESELKQQEWSKMHIGWLHSQPFNYFDMPSMARLSIYKGKVHEPASVMKQVTFFDCHLHVASWRAINWRQWCDMTSWSYEAYKDVLNHKLLIFDGKIYYQNYYDTQSITV